MLLEGKTAIVTGASGGIGKAIAIALAKEGASVAVHFHGNEEKALLVKKEIEEAGGKAEVFRANVADFEECNALVKAAAKTFGSIDILVNNAGITKDGLLMAMSEADFDDVNDTNLKGLSLIHILITVFVFRLLLQEFLPYILWLLYPLLLTILYLNAWIYLRHKSGQIHLERCNNEKFHQ